MAKQLQFIIGPLTYKSQQFQDDYSSYHLELYCSVFFTKSKLIGPVSPQAAQLGIQFLIAFTTHIQRCTSLRDLSKDKGLSTGEGKQEKVEDEISPTPTRNDSLVAFVFKVKPIFSHFRLRDNLCRNVTSPFQNNGELKR